MRNIILAFHDEALGQRIRQLLLDEGFYVQESVFGGNDVLNSIPLGQEGGLVICGRYLPDMTPFQLFSLLPEEYDLLLLSPHSGDILASAPEGMFFLHSFRPDYEIASAIQMLLQSRTLQSTSSVREKPISEKQDDIEKAKILLMDFYGITETSAHHFLQQKSMNNHMKMADIAQIVIRSLRL